MDYEALDTLLAVLSFVVGGMIGSFLNVCVYRIPKGESVVNPPSHCPKCGENIAWYDNIPVLSWLILGARCRNCKAPISWQYPLVEAITGTLFLLVFLRFGRTVASPVYMTLAASLVLVTFIDLTDWTIPDRITLPGIPIGIACSVLAMVYPASGLQIGEMHKDVFDSLIGVALGGGIIYALDKISLLLLKKHGMGFGDVKLLAMLGAFVGWKGVLLILIMACLVGSVVGVTLVAIKKLKGKDKEDHYLPFGPYLSVAGLLVVFFGDEILSWYMNMLMAQA